MNNRWSMRKSLALDVDLIVGDAECRRCRTRDVGLGGVFVECEPATVTLGRYAPVELVVKLAGDAPDHSHRFKGNVMHATEAGIGVAFRDFTVEDVRALQSML